MTRKQIWNFLTTNSMVPMSNTEKWDIVYDALNKDEDERPVVNAHWVWDKDGMDWNIGAWKCSECGAITPAIWGCSQEPHPLCSAGSRYCGNCGAKMTEPEEEENDSRASNR